MSCGEGLGIERGGEEYGGEGWRGVESGGERWIERVGEGWRLESGGESWRGVERSGEVLKQEKGWVEIGKKNRKGATQAIFFLGKVGAARPVLQFIFVSDIVGVVVVSSPLMSDYSVAARGGIIGGNIVVPSKPTGGT